MALRAGKKNSRPQRQKPPERPKALRRASLIEVAAANQDAAEKGKGALAAILSDTASPIYRQKQEEKKELEGDPKNGVSGTAAKEFKRCRPIVEMMEHVFTEPPPTGQALFGTTLFPRIPVDAQTGHIQVRLIKGCQGLTPESEPGRYIGKKDKKGNPKLTPLAEIETADGFISPEEWKEAAESRMSLFRKRLDRGHGPGWKSFREVKADAEDRKRGGKSIRGKWTRRFRLLKGCFGAYTSVTIPLTVAEPERDVEWHKQKVLNVSEVLHNNDDDNGWSHALIAFVEHCREKGFDLPANHERPWRELGTVDATGIGRSSPRPEMPPDGRTSPMVAGNKEWVIQAVKNPKLCAFTYVVEARILMQRAQDLSGAYQSFLRITTKADTPLCFIDPLLRKLYFSSFTADLRTKVASIASLRRSSTLGQNGGGVTPAAKTEAQRETLSEVDSRSVDVPESTGLSSEQLSVQEGTAAVGMP